MKLLDKIILWALSLSFPFGIHWVWSHCPLIICLILLLCSVVWLVYFLTTQGEGFGRLMGIIYRIENKIDRYSSILSATFFAIILFIIAGVPLVLSLLLLIEKAL